MFAIKLETLARRAFADVNASVCLQLVRDIFIAGQAECSLHSHLDSVGPVTPIRDIMDRCRVWESRSCRRHGQVGSLPKTRTSGDRVGRGSERPRVVYQVASIETDSKPKDALEDSDVLGMLMRRLLPSHGSAANEGDSHPIGP